jgi:nucleoside-diphosphate-sugar epimerase
MDWAGKQVLVTGAGGFIGSHLAAHLVELGARVRALVRYNSRNDWGLLEKLPQAIKDRLEVIPGDITDPFGTVQAMANCQMVFHLAQAAAWEGEMKQSIA